MEKYETLSLSRDFKKKKILKPIYSTNEQFGCGVIEYNKKTYLLDINDKDRIINFEKPFVFINEYDDYPSYSCNYKRFCYLDFLFNYNKDSVFYVFANKNKYDLRKSNVQIFYSHHEEIIKKYTVIDYIQGHYLKMGQDANVMKNPLWKIINKGKEYLIMFCEKDSICTLCKESYQKILDYEINNNKGKKITFFITANGYVSSSLNLYIHQIIMNCYGNGKGTLNISVDHIDQDPLNNTLENLRIATRKEQEQNSKGIKPDTKRERSSKKELPEGLCYEMLKKYVYYNREFYDKEKTKEREFFRVEHPKLDKPWCTSKSCKVSLQEKLLEANKVVDDLENDVYPEKEENILPKYVSLIIFRDKPHLVFEKRVNDKRLNLKMVLPKNYDLLDQLEVLNEKIKLKYETESIF